MNSCTVKSCDRNASRRDSFLHFFLLE